MFGNCFRFLFSFSYSQGKKKKTVFFFFFQNEKHVWLVVLKNTIFKNKIQEKGSVGKQICESCGSSQCAGSLIGLFPSVF